MSLYKLNMEGKRKPRSEEDALREWEARGRTAPPPKKSQPGPLGEPAVPMEQRPKDYGSLSDFSKKQTGRRRRVSRKTRKRARRGGRRI